MVMGGDLMKGRERGSKGGASIRKALSLSSVLLVACVLAVVVQRGEPPEERREALLSRSGVSKAHQGEKLIKSGAEGGSTTNTATERAIDKIKKRMMKSLDTVVQGAGKPESKRDKLRDNILKQESSIAALKLSSSNLFAKWERERTIARDAKTKAESLDEAIKQDKTKMHMMQLKLNRERHSEELATERQVSHATKQVQLSGVQSRADFENYFAQQIAKVKQEERANAAHKSKAAAATSGGASVSKKGVTVSLTEKPNVFDVLGPKKANERDEALRDLSNESSNANKLLLSAAAHMAHTR